MFTTIIITAAVPITLLAGVATINYFFQHSINRMLSHLVSFSAGVFLFLVGLMTIESLHELDNYVWVGGLILSGYALAWILQSLIPSFHHHHDDATCDEHKSGAGILVAGSMHNIIDGVILVPAFLVSVWVGIGTAIAIIVHELLLETSQFLVLRSFGYSVTKALLYSFLASCTIFIGIGIGYLLTDIHHAEGIILAVAAGFFSHIILTDLLPHNHHSPSSRQLYIHLALVLLGMGALVCVHLLSGGH